MKMWKFKGHKARYWSHCVHFDFWLVTFLLQVSGLTFWFSLKEHLVAATEHIRATLNACNASRRKAALTETITKQIGKRRIAVFKDYTEGKI